MYQEMQTTDAGVVLRFPVERRMSAEQARGHIGSARKFRYPALDGDERDPWLTSFLVGKRVLSGWTPVNDGLVSAFKQGRVLHTISDVYGITKEGYPKVLLCCGYDPCVIQNWFTTGLFVGDPVTLVLKEQECYFRLCKRCEDKNGCAEY